MNMKAASIIWDSLLQFLSKGKRSFYLTLTNAFLAEIVSPTATDPSFDARKTAMCKWLVHLATGRQWKQVMSVSQVELQTQIAETCLLDPSAWGHKLIQAIVDRADDEFRQLWGPLYEAVVSDGSMEMDDMSPDRLSTDDEPVSDAEPHVVVDDTMENVLGEASAKISARRGDVGSTVQDSTSKSKAKAHSHSKSVHGSSDRGWKLWEGGWVQRPIGV
jgi:hypothetical protein